MDNNSKEGWIKIVNGEFMCSECENTVKPLTNTEEGMVEANLEEIKKHLKEFPNKVIFAVCPICGMEYIFRLKEDDLWLEPSEEEK